MSESSLSTEIYLAVGTMLGGAILAIFGSKAGKSQQEDTKERVVGLSLAGGIYQTGQSGLAQQNITDALDLAKKAVEAVENLVEALGSLTESVSHFDDTTEREARDRTSHAIDQMNESIKGLLQREHTDEGGSRSRR